jgi:hypothetical protein
MATEDVTVNFNLDSTRPDLKPLIDQINSALMDIVNIVTTYPDTTAPTDCNVLPSGYRNVHVGISGS